MKVRRIHARRPLPSVAKRKRFTLHSAKMLRMANEILSSITWKESRIELACFGQTTVRIGLPRPYIHRVAQ